MAIIADILTQVDAAATAVGATAFDAVAAEIVPVFRVGSVLVVALIGINLMAQAVPMTLRNGLGLMVRITVASAFLSSWTNFNAVYGVLTNTPSEIGAVVIEAFGDAEEVGRAYAQATDRFADILETLVSELATLRRPVGDEPPRFRGPVARRMAKAVWPHRAVYITPMAAVAGAVADIIHHHLPIGQ